MNNQLFNKDFNEDFEILDTEGAKIPEQGNTQCEEKSQFNQAYEKEENKQDFK